MCRAEGKTLAEPDSTPVVINQLGVHSYLVLYEALGSLPSSPSGSSQRLGLGSHYTHFKDEESKAQSHDATCPTGGIRTQVLRLGNLCGEGEGGHCQE